MLRTQDVGAGQEMVGQSAQSLQGVGRFAVVAVAGDQTTQLAGAELTADELHEARWSYDNGRPVGLSIRHRGADEDAWWRRSRVPAAGGWGRRGRARSQTRTVR